MSIRSILAANASDLVAEGAPPNRVKSNRTVLHVITDLDVGGAERMLSNYAARPREDGVEMVVASIMRPGAMADTLMDAGIRVHDLGVPSHPIFKWPAMARAMTRLSGLVAYLHPEAVVGWMYHANLMARMALRQSGLRDQIRLYAGIRCSAMDVRHYSPVFRQVVRLSREQAPSFDAVIYNSEAGRREHEGQGFSARNTFVAWNGIDTERFQPNSDRRNAIRATLGIAPNERVAITAARVDPMKNYPAYLEALSRIPEPPTVLLAGKDTDNDALLPPAPYLRRLGVRNDIPDLMAAADYIVMPSAFGEGFPNALAEGMACGLIPITTDVGDAAIIAGDTGWIAGSPSALDLAEILAEAMALSDETLRARQKAARDRIVTEFSLDAACAAMDRATGLS